VDARGRAMSTAELDAKRAANIAKKDGERAAKNEDIKQDKAKKQAERAGQLSAKEKAEAEKQAKLADADAKRQENIRAKEENRRAKEEANAGKPKAGGSKYSKKDVLELKKVFDEYDTDKDGHMKLSEFTDELKKKKQRAAPKPGEKSTLQERNASLGTSIVDLSEGVFHEMDKDGDGEVTFEELCKLFFKHASAAELQTMLSWIEVEPEPEPEPEPTLSDESIAQIHKIFKLYDKDKSGTLTKSELVVALKSTGMEKDEIAILFKDYDLDSSGTIDKEEFLKLMDSTGAFAD